MQVSWKKHLRPIAALVALLTVGGLFGAVSANASDTTGGVLPPGGMAPGAQVAPLESSTVEGDDGSHDFAGDSSNLSMQGVGSGMLPFGGSLALAPSARSPLRRMGVMSLAAAPTERHLAEGQFMSGVKDIEDPATSIYVGGRMQVVSNAEIEGSVVVDGDLLIGGGNKESLLAGRTMWGMGFYPPAGADMLTVGGSFVNGTATYPQWVSGDARIGGTVTWGDGSTKNANGNEPLYVATAGNMRNDGWDMNNSAVKRWVYTDMPHTPAIRPRLGKSTALKVNINGKSGADRKTVDYNGYTASTLRPLSAKLKGLKANGTVSYQKAGVEHHRFFNENTVTTTGEGWIVFHGTGTGSRERQVFTIDLNRLEAQRRSLGVKQWSLDFENVPDGQAIVVNLTGSGDRTWHTGWRVKVNGQDYSTYIDSSDQSLSRFRSIASRLMWNIPDASHVTLDYAYGTLDSDCPTCGGVKGQETYGKGCGQGVLFPGSVLVANGSMTDFADTNGRLLVGKDLDLSIWEHHNAPWVGFDEPQKFTILGSTAAQRGKAVAGGTAAVSDTLRLRSAGADGKGRALYDLKTSNVKVILHYRGADGWGQSVEKTLPTVTLPRSGATVAVRSPGFTPSDLRVTTRSGRAAPKTWPAGDYWFETRTYMSMWSSFTVLDAADGTQADLSDWDTWNSGDTDASERFSLVQPPSVVTDAVKGSANASNALPVHDLATVNAPGAARVSVAFTLHAQVGARTLVSKAKTVGLGSGNGFATPSGAVKVPSAEFTPADLGVTGNWPTDSNKATSSKYWFDVSVTATGRDGSTAVVSHAGSADPREQFTIEKPNVRFSTAVSGAPSRVADTGAVTDKVTATSFGSGTDAYPAGTPFDAVSTLNWDGDGDGTADRSVSTPVFTTRVGATVASPSLTPKSFGWTHWKAGDYWFDLTATVNGAKQFAPGRGVDEESFTVLSPFTLRLGKQAYRSAGSVEWTGVPVAGARLTLTETTDGSGRTAVKGSKPMDLTTGGDGTVAGPTGTVAAGGSRWFRVRETAAPSGYTRVTGWWMIHVKGTADGAVVTAVGSDATAKIRSTGHQGSVWTVTIGDQADANVMFPFTGSARDAGLMLLAVAGAAGCAATGMAWCMRSRGRHGAQGRHRA